MAIVRPGRFHLIGEIISELRKVVWPSRPEITRLTVMVVAVAVTVGLFLGVIDLVFTELMRFLMGD
ncbi:MAG: preprotein translocase subunit SecE [Chloroflexi bacterium]|nr:preprotein translocase subunit SecE [Chloroflexota bacterium]